MPIDFSKFLELAYWFQPRPGILDPGYRYSLMAFFGCIVVLAVLFYLLRKRLQYKAYRTLYLKLGRLCLTFGLVGFAWLFFRDERIIYLGMRFWFLILLISMAVWLVFILRHYFIDVPKRKKELDEKKEFDKYLP